MKENKENLKKVVRNKILDKVCRFDKTIGYLEKSEDKFAATEGPCHRNQEE